MPKSVDVLILGSGVTGLSAAWVLGDRATLLEREPRPGGLVRTARFGDYWFDHVLHLLYFQDPETERCVRALMGETLVPCPPEAWCETSVGNTLFPFQMNLRGLEPESRDRCVRDLAEATSRPSPRPPEHFEDLLLTTFGRSMCEIFLLPYNRKVWKRPLNKLAAIGFTWNITRPDFEAVLRGAYEERSFQAYNSAGWYPRPPAGSPVRGMECLSAALATQVSDLRCGCDVQWVDPRRHEVVYRRRGKFERIRYGEALLSTLPLPILLSRCQGVPAGLRKACSTLRNNRVLSIAISMRGPRPRDPGHWRYYADESLIFNRLVFLNEFDPLCSPDDGWGLLAEITEPAESPMTERAELLARVRTDLERTGIVPEGSKIVGEKIMAVDPAYAVYGPDTQAAVDAAHRYLAARGVTSLGRYGEWKYSSMSSCMRDGRAWAATIEHSGQDTGLLAAGGER